MIDLSNYPLTYHEIETNKVFRGRRTSGTDYVLIDTTTGQKQFPTAWTVANKFRADVSNRKLRGGNGYRNCKKNIA